RIEVGHRHRVKPGNIVGAIANEADISSNTMGRIEIYEDFSTIDLPESVPGHLIKKLKGVRVAGQALNISRDQADKASSALVGKEAVGTEHVAPKKKKKTDKDAAPKAKSAKKKNRSNPDKGKPKRSAKNQDKT
ncbi:MAG: DbpA RNA binding domain-containing protein, partial [Limnobacter sp.]|nr:DbpA RNA binding domain-containing protein [Limnobacter sp.]